MSLPTSRLPSNRPADESAYTSSGDRSYATPSPTKAKEQERTHHSEWIDIDDAPKRRRKSRRTSTRSDGPTPSTRNTHRSSISELGRFLPKLSQILEGGESRPHQHLGAEDRASSRDKTREDAVVNYKRPVRGRNINIQRRQDSRAKLNASLLSVISGLTATTDRSSGSNSTVTQRSYSRAAHTSRLTHGSRARVGTPSTYSSSSVSRASLTYPAKNYSPDDEDARSDISASTASSLMSSRAGSSVVSGAPSSRSTNPSPTLSRDLPEVSLKADNCTRTPSSRHKMLAEHNQYDFDLNRQALDADSKPLIVEDLNGNADAISLASDQASVESPLPSHPHAYTGHFLHELRQDSSPSPPHSNDAGPLAVHSWPSNRSQEQITAFQEDLSQVVPPPAPDAPDITKKTVVGYELLASELCSSSDVRPMYRKFEYLNHRLLLHLQDELAELEEQLRTVDEMIAQMSAEDSGKRMPSTRRGEAYYGVDLHHYRTSLLGRVFIKTKQYNKALASYSTVVQKCSPAEPQDIQTYRAWITEHAPIHEVETQFLREDRDLVKLTQRSTKTEITTATITNTWPAYTPLALCAPLILLTLLPTTLLRLALFTFLLTGGTILAATSGWLMVLNIHQSVALASYACCLGAMIMLIPTQTGAAIAG